MRMRGGGCCHRGRSSESWCWGRVVEKARRVWREIGWRRRDLRQLEQMKAGCLVAMVVDEVYGMLVLVVVQEV